MSLTSARYGKDLVRVLRVVRHPGSNGEAGVEDAVHDVAEYNVRALVEGDIGVSFTEADNSVVVATDSMKNIIYYLAKISPHVLSPELFAAHIGAFLLEKYGHLQRAYVDVERLRWARIGLGDGLVGHAHSFCRDGEEKHVARVEVAKRADGALDVSVTGGLVDMLVLKSTGSSFAGFVRDEFTTLPETDDRILSTAIDMTYTFPAFRITGSGALDKLGDAYQLATAAEKARKIALRLFCEPSASVQATLFAMCKTLLSEHARIASVACVLPNKHYLPVDMSYVGIGNVHGRDAEVFMPVAAPSGRISATVTR